MSNRTKLEMTKSSGNVFADLGLPNPDECFAKAELAYQVNKLIKKRGISQIEAAKLLGIDQPKISALKRGRLSGFSIERLFKYLALLDQDIEIVIKPHKRSRSSKRTRTFVNLGSHVLVRYA